MLDQPRPLHARPTTDDDSYSRRHRLHCGSRLRRRCTWSQSLYDDQRL